MKTNQVTPKKSRLVIKVQEYFVGVNPLWIPGTSVKVLSDQTWNGHQAGEQGTISRKRITRVQGHPCDIIVTSVRWSDGTEDWGMHMDKLVIVK